ncbi:hypothetical protein L1049_022607 [Liquidambar formosana]|uniref:Uncharacterized protein n=1 Tax=Liquidambar formosana TaxID=63359 RepID=A0AAP0RCT2_LIQFO
MAKAGHFVAARNVNPIPTPFPAKAKSLNLLHRTSIIRASSRKNDFSLITRKNSRSPRRLIKISTAEGRWHGNWTCDYIFSLRQLRLEDLADDGHKDADVSINLCIHKHASFGLSVDGRIITSFTRKCSNCSSSYCREIDTTFNVWVLPSSRDNHSIQLPEIGGDDPSLNNDSGLQVIYVKPGYEADLDSLIQDTIRLTTSVNETCSESCEKSEPKLQSLSEFNQPAGPYGEGKMDSYCISYKNNLHLQPTQVPQQASNKFKLDDVISCRDTSAGCNEAGYP